MKTTQNSNQNTQGNLATDHHVTNGFILKIAFNVLHYYYQLNSLCCIEYSKKCSIFILSSSTYRACDSYAILLMHPLHIIWISHWFSSVWIVIQHRPERKIFQALLKLLWKTLKLIQQTYFIWFSDFWIIDLPNSYIPIFVHLLRNQSQFFEITKIFIKFITLKMSRWKKLSQKSQVQVSVETIFKEGEFNI